VADVFVAGVDGRVIVDDVIVGGLNLWTLEGQTSIIKLPQFEGPTDALSRTWIEKLFGLSDGQGTVEGYFNIGTGIVSDEVLGNGLAVALDLIIYKGTAFGIAVAAMMSNFRLQTPVENQPVKFSASFEVNGAITLATTL
jgi:hypothetical protein